jgi:prepilin-type N-terminal cleavage/methylation domain-containing protein
MDFSSTSLAGRYRRRAFTIIELLVVIAAIAILSGIFFGVARGVNERSRISRAQSELALLAQYLEQYRAHYGDYPRVDFPAANSAATGTKREGEDGMVQLYHALNGRREIRHNATPFAPGDRQRAFIDRTKFDYVFAPSLNPPNPNLPETDPVVLVDPWGNLYRYYYMLNGNATWRNPTYVLYSMGPSGEHEPPGPDGYSDRDHAKNTDNFYAN